MPGKQSEISTACILQVWPSLEKIKAVFRFDEPPPTKQCLSSLVALILFRSGSIAILWRDLSHTSNQNEPFLKPSERTTSPLSSPHDPSSPFQASAS